MMVEGFLDFLDKDFKSATRMVSEKIADFQESIAMLEPDKEEHSKKIELKRGNFPEVLK